MTEYNLTREIQERREQVIRDAVIMCAALSEDGPAGGLPHGASGLVERELLSISVDELRNLDERAAAWWRAYRNRGERLD
jgi:hypothetical protein